jgi:hypothetical protein
MLISPQPVWNELKPSPFAIESGTEDISSPFISKE